MTLYPYQDMIAFDPYSKEVGEGTGHVFAMSDTNREVPLSTVDEFGHPVELVANPETGFLPAFYVEDHVTVRFVSRDFTKILATTMPIPGPPGADGVPGMPGVNAVPTMEAVATYLGDQTSMARAALDAAADERFRVNAEPLVAPLVAEVISNDPTVAQAAAGLAQSDAGLQRRFPVASGTDPRTFAPGIHMVSSSGVAASLLNMPAEGVSKQGGYFTVTPGTTAALMKHIRWQIIPSSGDDTLAWECHMDSSGVWSKWYPRGNSAQTLTAADDFRALSPGTYIVPTFSVASQMANRPTGSLVFGQNPSSVTVSGGTAQARTIELRTAPTATEKSRTLRMHRDNGGAWSGWYEVGADPVAPTGEAALPTLAPLAAANHAHLRGAVRLSMTGAPTTHPARWTADAGAKLTTPTSDGSGQTVHPKVLDTGAGGWNGWRYWMAHTPYPYADDSKEDPEILVSANGTTWQVPAGLTNPLDDAPGSPGFYNSDTHLVLDNGTMYLVWRTSRVSPAIEDEINWRTSTDGKTWTPKKVIYRSQTPGAVYGQMLSPALIKTATGWRMFMVSANAHPNRMVYLDTTAANPGPADWSAPVRCYFDGRDELVLGRDVWHIDVIQDGSTYWALINDAVTRTGGVGGDLYLARSEDGINWDGSPVPLVPRFSAHHDALYRGCLLRTGSGDAATFDVFYSARVTQNQRFHLYRTTAARDI